MMKQLLPPLRIPGKFRWIAVFMTAGLFASSAPTVAETELYFKSASDADWHTSGIWSTDPGGSDSVDWTDGNHANLITGNFPDPGNIDIAVNTGVTVQSLNKITTSNDTFDIVGNGSTFTNSSGIYNVAGGSGSRLELANLLVAGDDTITKTGGGGLWFARNIQGVAPTHFNVREGAVRWSAQDTIWNSSTSIHLEAETNFDFTPPPGGSGRSYQISGLSGVGDLRTNQVSDKEFVLNIASGERLEFHGAITSYSRSIIPRGRIIKTGAGTQILGGVITMLGDVSVDAGTLGFAATSELRFKLEDGGVVNQVRGTGAATFDGIFRLDIESLTDPEGTWSLIDVANLSEKFGNTFTLAFVDGPTFQDEGGGIHTSGEWRFDTSTGILRREP